MRIPSYWRATCKRFDLASTLYLSRSVILFDHGIHAGHVSIAKAALALGMSDAHLSAMLDLVRIFASYDAQPYLLHEHQKVHVFGICTTLFIQFFGRHLFDASSQDTWPSFTGGLAETPVEQVELSKTTPSRSRPSKSGNCTMFKQLLLYRSFRFQCLDG